MNRAGKFTDVSFTKAMHDAPTRPGKFTSVKCRACAVDIYITFGGAVGREENVMKECCTTSLGILRQAFQAKDKDDDTPACSQAECSQATAGAAAVKPVDDGQPAVPAMVKRARVDDNPLVDAHQPAPQHVGEEHHPQDHPSATTEDYHHAKAECATARAKLEEVETRGGFELATDLAEEGQDLSQHHLSLLGVEGQAEEVPESAGAGGSKDGAAADDEMSPKAQVEDHWKYEDKPGRVVVHFDCSLCETSKQSRTALLNVKGTQINHMCASGKTFMSMTKLRRGGLDGEVTDVTTHPTEQSCPRCFQ